MAMYALRLRRALISSPSLLRRPTPWPTAAPLNPSTFLAPPLFIRSFKVTPTSLCSPAWHPNAEPAWRYEIRHNEDPNAEPVVYKRREQNPYHGAGGDLNHWLIFVDFPKDPPPSPAEMISFYESTAAQIFGSLEEAKKRIYACDTSRYFGFQVECCPVTAYKFEALPRIRFVMPDSYVDPINKEYTGDKYINGKVIPVTNRMRDVVPVNDALTDEEFR